MYLIETDRPSVPIEDLKIVVRAGVPSWITWEQKRASACLRRLEAIGHVQVSPGDRAREEKPPPRRPPPSVRLSRPGARPAPPPPAPPPTTYTQEEVDRLLNQAADRASKATADALFERLQGILPSAPPAPSFTQTLEERVEAAVSKAMEKNPVVVVSRSGDGPAPTSSSAKKRSRGPEEPLFVPSGIVSADDSTELTLDSESSDDEGLGDAAAALRALRKGKKKKES